MNTPLLALLGRHLTCLPCGVAALVVGQPYALGILLVEQSPLAVYLRRDDRLVRRTAALYGGELGVGYLMHLAVDIEELRHAELAVRAVAEELVASVLYPLPAPAELHQLFAEDSPETYPLATDLNGAAHCGKIHRKPIDKRHYLCCRGGRLVAEYR